MGNAVGIEREDPALTVSSSEAPRPVHFEDHAERDGGTRDFTYAWPAEVSAIPELSALLTRRREAALEEQKADWNAALAEFAGEDCATCKSRGFIKGWTVAADTPRFLSLKGEISLYTGGAHPNSAFDALVWDREAGEALEPLDLFTSPGALERAVRAPYCEALVAQQQERRGQWFTPPADPTADCPALDALVVVPSSIGGEAVDEVYLLAAPYIAGAYAEGPYKVRLPVTDDLIAAVKEEYRAAFAVP
ncbi:MAG: hypothetical protein GVX90_06750 [Alphaproteobacteria bacterium]|jgi:hypothetical protein|nr:hypothetical protein [Alphaproteobacteria bacterium]